MILLQKDGVTFPKGGEGTNRKPGRRREEEEHIVNKRNKLTPNELHHKDQTGKNRDESGEGDRDGAESLSF